METHGGLMDCMRGCCEWTCMASTNATSGDVQLVRFGSEAGLGSGKLASGEASVHCSVFCCSPALVALLLMM